MEFTAADEVGQYLDLTAGDVEILENGELQKLELFQEAVEPVSIVLALDASGSMKKKESDVIASARDPGVCASLEAGFTPSLLRKPAPSGCVRREGER